MATETRPTAATLDRLARRFVLEHNQADYLASHAALLAPDAAVHEYLPGLPAALLSPAVRLLAAADVYRALTEPRPHRPARSADAAAAELRREVRAGRLDGDAAESVLAAAGHRARPVRRDRVAGLSEREIEVLRLIARGATVKQAAAALSVSRKTVDHHVESIYGKIGVSTRAGATLFAMEQGLLEPAG